MSLGKEDASFVAYTIGYISSSTWQWATDHSSDIGLVFTILGGLFGALWGVRRLRHQTLEKKRAVELHTKEMEKVELEIKKLQEDG